MSYLKTDFYKDVFELLKHKKNTLPTKEECMAVSHHMEYNIRADRSYANNGHLKISTSDLRLKIIAQIKNNLHANDIPRYIEEYQKYKDNQKNWKLTPKEENDIKDIALLKKKVSDFDNKDYLKNIYIKYFNQKVLPHIKKISLQVKNKLDYHGIWHTEQVALFAIDIAVEENLNPLPILLAAALHDCARKNDRHDPQHGINCEPIARNYLNNIYQDKYLLNKNDIDDIIFAITHHNVPPKDENNKVLNCLQDADSIRLWWKNGQSYPAHTKTAQRLSMYGPYKYKQIKYLRPLLEKMRATSVDSSQKVLNQQLSQTI